MREFREHCIFCMEEALTRRDERRDDSRPLLFRRVLILCRYICLRTVPS
jgi:hypothetical protein